jgi:hypothetical protein
MKHGYCISLQNPSKGGWCGNIRLACQEQIPQNAIRREVVAHDLLVSPRTTPATPLALAVAQEVRRRLPAAAARVPAQVQT